MWLRFTSCTSRPRARSRSSVSSDPAREGACGDGRAYKVSCCTFAVDSKPVHRVLDALSIVLIDLSESCARNDGQREASLQGSHVPTTCADSEVNARQRRASRAIRSQGLVRNSGTMIGASFSSSRPC